MKRADWRVMMLSAALWLCGCGDPTLVEVPNGGNPSGNDPIEALATNAEVRLPGLGGKTQVVFDDAGMPHIYAPDMATALYVQGYVTAQARFWEMDIIRRFAEGRLSEVLGRATINTDMEMRTMFTTRDGRRLHLALWDFVKETDPEMASLAQSYADGVNAWLADLRAGRNEAHLPPEYTLPYVIGLTAEELDEWEPADSLAVGRLQAYSLSDSSGEEISLARIFQKLPEAMRRDIYRSAPTAPTTILPPRQGTAAGSGGVFPSLPEFPSPDVLDLVAQRLDELQQLLPIGSRSRGAGSNNWIVSPALSANGHAMLANDPHLALYNPAVWHMIHLSLADTGENISGVIFPGLPGVILGYNDVGAWGATTAGFDVTDVYVEDVETPPDYPASPRTVLFKGARVPVLRVEDTIEVKGSQPVKHIIEVVPHHGPMAADPNPRDSIVGLAATGMTVRWTGHEMTNDSRFLLDLGRSRSVDDFKAALRNFGTGAQNWIWADVKGNIAYSTQVLIPQRPAGTVPYLPMSGTGDAEWLTDAQGRTLWLPAGKIPQALNPAEGFLVTANNDHIGVTLDNDPLNDEIYLGYSFDNGFRAQRIREMLTNSAGDRTAGSRISAADMSRFQYDHSSKQAARLLPFLFAAAQNRPDLVDARMNDALARLSEWATAKPGSPACDTLSGVDAHDLREDIAPRRQPVSAEEKADAVATSIYTGWITRLTRLVFSDDFAGTGIGTPGGDDAIKGLLHILEDIDRTDPGFRVHTKGENGESTLWDRKDTPQIETRDEILLSALGAGLTFLEQKFGTSDMDRWLWGLIHGVQMQHFIGQAGLPIFDLGPFAAPGHNSTVNPAAFSLNSDDYTFSGGPSMRFVVVLDPQGVHAVNVLPGGNNGDPGATADENLFNLINPAIHYGDHVHEWVNGETFEMRFHRRDVAAHAEKKIVYLAQ